VRRMEFDLNGLELQFAVRMPCPASRSHASCVRACALRFHLSPWVSNKHVIVHEPVR
jgi:hypothetical protein